VNAFSLAGRSVSPLLREALPQLSQVARAIGMDLQGAIVVWTGSTTAAPTARRFSIEAWMMEISS
jgi:hypothetical protein